MWYVVKHLPRRKRIGLTGAQWICAQRHITSSRSDEWKTSTRLNVLMSVWLSTTIETNMKHYDNMPQRNNGSWIFFFECLLSLLLHTVVAHFSKTIKAIGVKKHIYKTGYITHSRCQSCRTNLISHNMIMSHLISMYLLLFGSLSAYSQCKWI